jgi:hypothetical protein
MEIVPQAVRKAIASYAIALSSQGEDRARGPVPGNAIPSARFKKNRRR